MCSSSGTKGYVCFVHMTPDEVTAVVANLRLCAIMQVQLHCPLHLVGKKPVGRPYFCVIPSLSATRVQPELQTEEHKKNQRTETETTQNTPWKGQQCHQRDNGAWRLRSSLQAHKSKAQLAPLPGTLFHIAERRPLSNILWLTGPHWTSMKPSLPSLQRSIVSFLDPGSRRPASARRSGTLLTSQSSWPRPCPFELTGHSRLKRPNWARTFETRFSGFMCGPPRKPGRTDPSNPECSCNPLAKSSPSMQIFRCLSAQWI